MTAANLNSLAERVEAAAGPDRELFLEAFSAIFGPEPEADYQPRREPNFAPTWSEWTARKCRFHRLLQAEAWTDSAMTLVPEGFDFGTGHGLDDSDRQGWAWCGEGSGPYRWAATAALALTAACLRARSATLREASSKARTDGGKRG